MFLLNIDRRAICLLVNFVIYYPFHTDCGLLTSIHIIAFGAYYFVKVIWPDLKYRDSIW